MECFTPTGSVYQAGTFSGNPLSLCAGDSTINYIEKNNYCVVVWIFENRLDFMIWTAGERSKPVGS